MRATRVASTGSGQFHRRVKVHRPSLSLSMSTSFPSHPSSPLANGNHENSSLSERIDDLIATLASRSETEAVASELGGGAISAASSSPSSDRWSPCIRQCFSRSTVKNPSGHGSLRSLLRECTETTRQTQYVMRPI